MTVETPADCRLDPTRRMTKLSKRMPLMTRFKTLISAGCLLMLGTQFAPAQENLFAPRLIVNDRAITQYEVNQRMQFMQLLRSPGDLEKGAIDALVEDRLRMEAANRAGLKATPEQIQAGMEEFAGRANLTAEQFIEAIGQGGIDAQTFRDFVEAGFLWREVVRQKFGTQGQVTEVEIDRAIEGLGRQTALRVLISEMILPAPPGSESNALALARRLQSEIKTEAGFAAAARNYSASASRARGGRMDWIPITNLPPQIAPFVLGLGPGQVSDPVQIPNGVALFQLRGVEETNQTAASSVSVEYAEFFVPNDGNAEAELQRIAGRVDTCDDLYGIAKGLPAEQLLRETKTMAEVPQDVGLQLAQLDANEFSTALTRGNARVFLMLCSRTPKLETPPSRDDIRAQLVNQRLASLADGYLEALRADAIIREP